MAIENTWVHRFHDQLLLTYQQEGSQLERLVPPDMVHRDVSGAIDHHDRLGNVIANDVVAPFGQTVILNPQHSRRGVVLQSSDAAVLVSDEHTLRAMINPQNGYTRTIAFALGRRADKRLIDSLIGTSMTVTVDAASGGQFGYGTQAMLSTHIIGTGIATTLTNIITINELLSKASVPPSGRVMLYSPGQLRDVMAITQASSSDFTKNQIHDRGTIDGLVWEGLEWVQIADVVDPALTVLHRMLPLSATTRQCIAFHKSAVGLSIGRPQGPPMIDPRPDLQSRPLQVRQAIMQGAVRVWEGGVVRLDVLEN